ncbi:lipoyl protein ligase domain-containing protein [Celeribacter baekdonensis]|uniref:BPL/LPL catalytic domain-containing protein n=1 Tax=Celeribacter baekdonensis TaxID=875171 RepID=A0A2R4M277_9RHOB|nr:hypothetical protein [Celeribacter baekdonensis]AVW91314.1 hypothetical protein DA792_09665 [Celeribacter baekdonensis]
MIVAPFRTAADGIARETALLQAGQPALLLWQAEETALVMPHALARRDDMQIPLRSATAEGCRIAFRGSGGGIVPQGSATLNLAMVLPCRADFTMEDGYRMICGTVAEALTRFEVTTHTGSCPGAFCDGAWNVLAEGRKLAGTAQRWRATPEGRVALLHAAILLHMPDPATWVEMGLLHRAAFPAEPPLRPDAHITLDRLMPATMSHTRFPGALIRAAEDRLSASTRREERAA